MKVVYPLIGVASLLCFACSASASPPRIAVEDLSVPALDPGITLYVRNKHPAGLKTVRAERIVLFVHGATYPSETTFDLPLNGVSWMDFIARHGYDVYLVDLRGYGRSTRPAEMDAPADENEPIVRTETAVRDVTAAVNFILKRRSVHKLSLLGWSWGTTIMGWYTSQHNDKVGKLVLYAPAWVGKRAPGLTGGAAKLGAYRTVTAERMKSGWLAGVPESKKPDFIPAGWFESFVAANLASDPVGSRLSPPVLRAPNGVLADNRDFWAAGKPLYDPAGIRVPTFLVHAEWDAVLPSDLLYEYFAKLVNVPYKRYVQIGEGTHFVMMEKNRMQVFEAVQQFLDEDFRVGE